MWEKLIIISLCITVLFVFSAPISTVNAGDRNIKVNWEIVGTIVGGIPLFIPFTTDLAGVHSLLNLSAQGPPGSAKITGISRFNESSGSKYNCPSDYQDGYMYFDKNDVIAEFPNHSFLFVTINDADRGILCLANGVGTYFHVKLDVNGGTGYYDGASGELDAEGYDPTASSDGTLSGLIGTITGTIEFSD